MIKAFTMVAVLALGATPGLACEYMKQQRDTTANLSQTPVPQTSTAGQLPVSTPTAAQTAEEPAPAPQPEMQTAQTLASPDQPKSH